MDKQVIAFCDKKNYTMFRPGIGVNGSVQWFAESLHWSDRVRLSILFTSNNICLCINYT